MNVNVIPAMDHKQYYNNGYSLSAMLSINHSITAPQTGHQEESARPIVSQDLWKLQLQPEHHFQQPLSRNQISHPKGQA